MIEKTYLQNMQRMLLFLLYTCFEIFNSQKNAYVKVCIEIIYFLIKTRCYIKYVENI